MKMLEEAKKATIEVVNDPLRDAIKAANDALSKLNAIEHQETKDEKIDEDESVDSSTEAGVEARNKMNVDALAQVKAGLKMLETLEDEVKEIVKEEKLRRKNIK